MRYTPPHWADASTTVSWALLSLPFRDAVMVTVPAFFVTMLPFSTAATLSSLLAKTASPASSSSPFSSMPLTDADTMLPAFATDVPRVNVKLASTLASLQGFASSDMVIWE